MSFVAEHTDAPEINLSNANAVAFLLWLGYTREQIEPNGFRLPARDLAARCRRRLWPERRNEDPGAPVVVDRAPGRSTVIDCGRHAGYFQQRAAQLLVLAELAGQGDVTVW
jgi:hypothetical protein